MKNKIKYLITVLSIIAIIFISSGLSSISSAGIEPTARKIVVFKQGALDDSQKDDLIKKAGGFKNKDLRLLDGMSVNLSARAEKFLAAQENVLRIDDDVIVYALENPGVADILSDFAGRFKDLAIRASAIQSAPWGIIKIDANDAWSISTGDPIKVAVIDTGIDLKHPDLAANIKGGYNAIRPSRNANDDNGHGTHVAGIVAALNNSFGVVGVGPKIDLYAVKVLNASGSGYLSDIIEGLDWAIQNKMQVANLSLGTTADIQSLHDAVARANQAGIVVVAAAGNDGSAVNYPAAYPESIAVAATDQNNNVPYWSSRGSQIDLAAPGVSIYSTYRNQSYRTLSGTSMATPHVAGTAALVLTQPQQTSSTTPDYDINLNGKWDPSEVLQKMEDTATDLGAAGFDTVSGWGLVNAYQAVK